MCALSVCVCLCVCVCVRACVRACVHVVCVCVGARVRTCLRGHISAKAKGVSKRMVFKMASFFETRRFGTRLFWYLFGSLLAAKAKGVSKRMGFQNGKFSEFLNS